MKGKMIFLLLLILVLFSCERDWISGEFIKPDASQDTSAQEEPAKEEPVTIKNTDPKNNISFNLSDKLIFTVGTKDDEIGVLEGGEDELPTGPMSFAVNESGEIYILDSINGKIKGFDKNKMIKGLISLGEKAKSVLDIAITKDNQLLLADLHEDAVLLLSSQISDITTPDKKYRFNISDFSGIFTTNRGNILLRYGNQQTLKLNDTGIHIPFMSLLSRNETMFLRTKRISESLSMLFMSSKEQSSEYKGNTEKQIEIMIDKPILSISYLDTDKNDRVYLLVEADDGADQTIKVKRYVIRTGTHPEDWSKPIEIPLDIYAHPFKDIVIGNDGTIYAMLVYKDRIEVAKWKTE